MLRRFKTQGESNLAHRYIGSEQTVLGFFNEKVMNVLARVFASFFPQQVAQVVGGIAYDFCAIAYSWQTLLSGTCGSKILRQKFL